MKRNKVQDTIIINALSQENKNNLNSTSNFKKRVAAYARVSTDSEEQLTSYKSQIEHYTKLIKATPNWDFVGIYADEGITGTKTKNRIEFKKMIDDALNGKIDIIIAKSISRFARNTLDTLSYVRILRERNVDIFFEKENIHTLNLDSEMFLTLYSAFAQAESESISENMKLGLSFKMKSGKMVGKYAPYGYKYNKNKDKLIIVEEEAKIVRRIFEEYASGIGLRAIARKLTKEGYLSPKGKKWHPETMRRMIKNEKYVGDLLTGKSYKDTVLSDKRKINNGEKPKYFTANHHIGIVSQELYNRANEILEIRSKKHKDKVDKYSRRYAFSSKIYCGCCGQRFIRKSYIKNKNKPNSPRVIIWGCRSHFNDLPCDCYVNYKEEELKEMFIAIFNQLYKDFDNYSKIFLSKIDKVLKNETSERDIKKLEKEKIKLIDKQSKLLDLMLDNKLDKILLQTKSKEIDASILDLNEKIENLENTCHLREEKEKQLQQINEVVKNTKNIDQFDDDIFESVVDKIIIGEKLEDGSMNYKSIKFILKTGLTIETDSDINNYMKKITKNSKSTINISVEKVTENFFDKSTAYVQHERSSTCRWYLWY